MAQKIVINTEPWSHCTIARTHAHTHARTHARTHAHISAQRTSSHICIPPTDKSYKHFNKCTSTQFLFFDFKTYTRTHTHAHAQAHTPNRPNTNTHAPLVSASVFSLHMAAKTLQNLSIP